MDPIDKAISCIPGQRQKDLAEALGVSYEAVRKWRNDGVPPERCKQIEQITRGEVKRVDLRPDIFGPIDEAAA